MTSEPSYQVQTLQGLHTSYNKKIDDSIKELLENFQQVIAASKVNCCLVI